MTLNSQPLSYMSSEDSEDPLWYKVLSLPDPLVDDGGGAGCYVLVLSDDFTRRMKRFLKEIEE